MKVKILSDFETRSDIALLNKNDEDTRDSRTNLAQISFKEQKKLVHIIRTAELVPQGTIGLPPNIAATLGVDNNDVVSIGPRIKPESFDIIKKKYEHQRLSKEEIALIIEDIYKGNLSDLEMAAFTLAIQYESLSKSETEYLTTSFANYGTKIQFDEPVYDKHSIGGIPGNKVSLLIVPIIAAAGLLIPKTSSRAITSPSGTADTMEVLADVSFSPEEIHELAPKSRGMIVWAGTLNLVPVDSEIISRVERPLRLDPESVIIASILSKKLSLGVDNLVLDMPTGPGTKVETREDATNLANLFVDIARRVGIRLESALTYADQPVGHAIGPALEAKEALETLMGAGPRSVQEKSVELSGILIEMAKLAPLGQGASYANDILASGKALEKFREIIEVQNGKKAIMPDEIELGQYTMDLVADRDGYISSVSNTAVKQISSALGCPIEKKAGIYLFKKAGEFVKKGTPLVRLYATHESHIDAALKIYKQTEFHRTEGMVLERIGSSTKSELTGPDFDDL